MRLGELVDAGCADIRTGPFGTQLKASSYVAEGRPVLNVRNVGLGDVRPDKFEFIDEKTAERLSGHLLLEGDIVFGRKGAVERHAFIQEPYVGALQGSDCIRLRLGPRSPVASHFVSYALRMSAHQAWMQRHCAHGSTMASLNQDILRLIELPCPPRETQRRIIQVLAAFDELIENNRRRIEILEETARSLYREWFVRFRFPGHESATFVDSPLGPGPIPDGWIASALGDLATLVRGRSYRKHELAEGTDGVPFLNLKCMTRGGGFRESGLKRYTGTFKDAQKALPGDIVMAVTDLTQDREIMARPALVPALPEGYGVISLDLLRVVPARPLDTLYLYWQMRSPGFTDPLKEQANGATVLHLPPAAVAGAPVVMPPELLRDQFVMQAEPLSDLMRDLSDQIRVLSAARDLLLPKLVTGAIEVESLGVDDVFGWADLVGAISG